MSITKAAILGATLMAAACAAEKSAERRKLTDGTMTCGYQATSHRVYSGADLQARIAVQANSAPCVDVYGWNNLSANGSRLITAPSHGKVEIYPEDNRIGFSYQPDPGFTGADRFRISTPGAPDAFNVAITVTVEP